MISIALMIIFLVIFLNLKREHQFYVLTLCILFPFTLGSVKSIPSVRISEWLNPILLLMLLSELYPLRGFNKLAQQLSFKGIGFFFIAFTILIIWGVNSYLNHEVFVQQEIGISMSNVRGLVRTYFNIINNIIIFFNVILFMFLYHKEINIEKWLNLIIIVSLALGFIRLAAFFFDINVPFMASGYGYGVGTTLYGGQAFRLSGLTAIAGFGLSALLAKLHITKKLNYIFTLIFLAFAFLLSLIHI